MTLDLAKLNEIELQRLELVLRALPGDKLLDAVAWEQVGEVMSAPRTATVGSTLAEIEAMRARRHARFELHSRIGGVLARVGTDVPEPTTPRECREVEQRVAEVEAHLDARLADIAAGNARLEADCMRYRSQHGGIKK